MKDKSSLYDLRKSHPVEINLWVSLPLMMIFRLTIRILQNQNYLADPRGKLAH